MMVLVTLRNIFLAILLCSVTLQHSNQEMCSSSIFNKTFDLSFFVRKNKSCHYITKWSLKNTAPNLPDNMKIDVKSSMFESGGLQTFHLYGETIAPPQKPASYELFPGIGYYKFYPDGVPNYNQASQICARDGAHLAVLNSEAEANVLKELYARYPKAKEWAYIGFNDFEVEGQFVTIFGNPVKTSGYNIWHPGMPDSGRDENCGSIHRTALLNDLWCSKHGPWPFFCEFDLSWD